MPPNCHTPSSGPYLTPIASTETEYQIKKSRFIARLVLAHDRTEAMYALAQAKRDYPDARHHCWAYVFGPPESPKSVAMSDDGEPSGTAGKPILNVMQHKDIGDAMLVVIRYFGGIKLGAGGLVRAYSQAAQLIYEKAPTQIHLVLEHYQIGCDFADEQNLRHWLKQHEGQIVDLSYRAEGSQQVCLYISLAAEHFQALIHYLGGIKNAYIMPSKN